MRKRPQQQRAKMIVESILEGTQKCISEQGILQLTTPKISEKSELINKKIRDSNLPEDIRVGAIIRDDKVIIPRSNFIFEKNDLVVFLAKREELKAVESIFSLGTV